MIRGPLDFDAFGALVRGTLHVDLADIPALTITISPGERWTVHVHVPGRGAVQDAFVRGGGQQAACQFVAKLVERVRGL